MWDIGRAVEDGVDTMADIGPDDAAAPRLGMSLNNVPKLAEQRARLDQLDSLLKAFASRLGDADRVRVSLGPVADVVSLIQIAMVAFMVQRDVEVDNITIKQDPLVRYPMANYLVNRGADRLREVVIVEG